MDEEKEVCCSFCGRKKSDDLIILRSTIKDNTYICENCLDKAKAAIANILSNTSAEAENSEAEETDTPHDIAAFLDQYVVGQDEAKRKLAVAVYNHYKILDHTDNADKDSIEIEKSNILMVGPSGCGKTHLIKSLARLFRVPYAIADATTLTESGYVGADVETVLQKLLNNADGDIKQAERGIVFIDEIDKKANKAQENNSITRDVSGEGVQQALLKLIEGSEVEVQLTGQRRHPYSDTVTIDTSKILFVVGGAFPGIEQIIKRRQNYKSQASVGIALSSVTEKLSSSAEYNEVIMDVTHDDFRKYGLIPEFLGRLPIICPLKELTEEELCKILTEPKNALVKQYQEMLKYDNVELKFNRDALEAIAKKAIKNKTGARGLRSILEDTLLDVMFDVPATMRHTQKHATMVITKECIEAGADPKLVLCA